MILTLTLTDADAGRLSAASAALGYASPAVMAATMLQEAVRGYELNQQQQHAANSYTPIVPTDQ